MLFKKLLFLINVTPSLSITKHDPFFEINLHGCVLNLVESWFFGVILCQIIQGMAPSPLRFCSFFHYL